MLKELKQIIEKASPSFTVTYEEKHLFNIRADSYPYFTGEPNTSNQIKARYAYIEEFQHGKYSPNRFFLGKRARILIYFFELTQLENDAETRERIRINIERDAIFPFIEEFKTQNPSRYDLEWSWTYPPAQFDANEVGVLLEFDMETTFCEPPEAEREEENLKPESPCKTS